MKNYEVSISFGEKLAKTASGLPECCVWDADATFGWRAKEGEYEDDIFGIITITDGEKVVDGAVLLANERRMYFCGDTVTEVHHGEIADADIAFLTQAVQNAFPILEHAYREWRCEEKLVVIQEHSDAGYLMGPCRGLLLVENYDSKFLGEYTRAFRQWAENPNKDEDADSFLHKALCVKLGYRYKQLLNYTVLEE